MQARRQSPDSIPEKYALEKRDSRDSFSIDQRLRYITRLEEEHEQAVAFGGPEAIMADGYPWIDYGRPSGKELLAAHRVAVKLLVETYTEDFSLFAGDRGFGKTMFAYFEAGKLYRVGVNVVSNMSPDFGYFLTTAADLACMVYAPAFTLFLIDEIHNVMNRYRQTSNFQQEMVASCANMRKGRIGIFGITSQDGSLGGDAKSQIRWVFYPYEGLPIGTQIVGPAWSRTIATRIGPWPDEWRGRTLADQRGLAHVRREPCQEVDVFPRPLALWWRTPGLYNSFLRIPSMQEGGGRLRAGDIRDKPGVFTLVEADGNATQYGHSLEVEDAIDITPTLTEMVVPLATDLLDAWNLLDPDSETFPVMRVITRMEDLHRHKYDRTDVLKALKATGIIVGERQNLLRSDLEDYIGAYG